MEVEQARDTFSLWICLHQMTYLSMDTVHMLVPEESIVAVYMPRQNANICSWYSLKYFNQSLCCS